MKTKLIKISDTHYIGVDNSEIKAGEWAIEVHNGETEATAPNFLDKNGNRWWVRQMNMSCAANDPEAKRITHSTQPLDSKCLGCNGTTDCEGCIITPFTLSEVEEAINGYSVEGMAKERGEDKFSTQLYIDYFTEGFKAHEKLVKDKLFTVGEVFDIFKKGVEWMDKQLESDGKYAEGYSYQQCFNDNIQPFLPKTEWDVEFDEQGKIKLV